MKCLTKFVYNGFIESIIIAYVSFAIIDKIVRTETTGRNILDFTSFFASFRLRVVGFCS